MLNLATKTIHWDAHGCPPFKIGSDLSFLHRYKKAGVNVLIMNVGFDLTTQEEAIALIQYFNSWVAKHSEQFIIIKTKDDIEKSRIENKLCIAFDIEGANLLNNEKIAISKFYELGVRQLVFAYNTTNKAGGGCLDQDIGLTQYGKDLLRECNQIGMVIDCSHVSYTTSMDIIHLSKDPIIFSHSNPRKLIDHPRNITDEQIKACAEKNGVIGINGIGIFLGNNDTRTEKIVEHIDYVTQLVGPEYVGIGLDCVFAEDELKNYVKENPDIFPSQHGFNNVAVANPEQFAEIPELLIKKGYSQESIAQIMGGNFYRVAKAVWRL